MNRLAILLVAALISEVLCASSLTEGQRAYETTLFALLRDRCVRCHAGGDASPSGPAFAPSDVATSYERVRRYVRFDDVARSFLVQRGGNRHCLNDHGFDCATGPEELTAAIRAWWETGERNVRSIRPQTQEQSLPSGSATLRWDLSQLMGGEAGTAIELEVEKFREARSGVPGAYLFRRPRLISPRQAIRIADLRFVLNGREETAANIYSSIDIVVDAAHGGSGEVSSQPLLSPHSLVLLQDRSQGDQLALSFGRLEVVGRPRCIALSHFERAVAPLIEAGNCRSCHGNATGPEHAVPRQRLSLIEDPEKVCRQVLERGNPLDPRDSVFFALGFRGMLDHPAPTVMPERAIESFAEWLRIETGVSAPSLKPPPPLIDLPDGN